MTLYESAIEKRQRAMARRPTMKSGALLDIGTNLMDNKYGFGKPSTTSRKEKSSEFGSESNKNLAPRALYTYRKFVVGDQEELLEKQHYDNLMFERRVRRGSNFCRPPRLETGDSSAAKIRTARSISMNKNKETRFRAMKAHLRILSPPPIYGKRHVSPVPELDLQDIDVDPDAKDLLLQRELWVEIPPSPIFIPAYIGFDEETQIYREDLCDFEMEVQPILEILVGRTVEQALDEVLHEKEMEETRERHESNLRVREADAAELQRMAEREFRIRVEKERRQKDYCKGVRIQKELEERVAAASLVQGYFADLLPQVLQSLEESRFDLDNIRNNIEINFMPWLVQKVTVELNSMVLSSDMLCNVVKDIIDNKNDQYRGLYEFNEAEEVEEEGTLNVDDELNEHLKLKDEIRKSFLDIF